MNRYQTFLRIKNLTLILLVAFNFSYAQNPPKSTTDWIDGDWEWTKTQMGSWFTIYLTEGLSFPMGPTLVKGAICAGVSGGGMNAVDCCGDDTKSGNKIQTIFGTFSEKSWMSGKNDELEVTFKTCYGSGEGEAIIKRMDANTITWKITKQPDGGCSIPESGTLKKKKKTTYMFKD